MRSSQLLTSLCLAQAALAAPILLVAGSSAKAVFLRPARQMKVSETAQVVFVSEEKHASKPSTTWEATSASLLESEGPMTTADLMALSEISASAERQQDPSSQPAKLTTTTTTSSNKGKISVGTLVVPGSKPKTVISHLFDPKVPRPYLMPGYYVSSQRADILVVGIILAFVLVVLAVETYGPVSRTVARLFQHQNPIRLGTDGNDSNKYGKVQGMEHADYADDEEEDDESDDDDMAPFGSSPRRASPRGLRLPEKVDEKATWI